MTHEINTCTSSRKELDKFFQGCLNAEEKKCASEVIGDFQRMKYRDGEVLVPEDYDELHDPVLASMKLNHGKWCEGGHMHFNENRSPRYAALLEWIRK